MPRLQNNVRALALAFALARVARGADASAQRANEAPRARQLLDTSSADAGSWSTGTATWYGGKDGPGPDGMSIFTGSCKYGENIPSHFVAALNTDGGYDWGLSTECGECYEVLCVDGRQRGLSDSVLGPWAGCVSSGSKSITVVITDSCPCHHPNPSNQRWCCGGENSGSRHFDLSYAAFDSIAIRHRGVVDVKYRKTSCDTLGQEKYYS